MKIGFHVIDSQKFISGRGTDSLIDVARIQAEGNRSFFVRISIELKHFASIEVWSSFDLSWKEVHSVPQPLVRPTLDENIEQLTQIGIEILTG